MRPFNTYGPRQSARAVIPTILSQLYQEAKQIKLGTLHPTRDFNFVQDVVSAFLAVGETEVGVGRVMNVGSGKETSIGELVELLFQITGKRREVVCEKDRLRPEKSEVDRLLCDASLIRNLIGWKPLYSLEKGLENTARWVKDNIRTFRSEVYHI
jgi:dTDP-glucose 4,6-dehydratase